VEAAPPVIASAIEPVAPIVSVPAVAPSPAVPRADAEEDAVLKPLGTVVSVRRARVRSIGVVAVRAHRRRAVVHRRSDPYADHHSLCLSEAYGNEAKAEQRKSS
jgi:hypothetical protein